MPGFFNKHFGKKLNSSPTISGPLDIQTTAARNRNMGSHSFGDNESFDLSTYHNRGDHNNGSMIDSEDKISLPGYLSPDMREMNSILSHESGTRWGRFKDSFKPADMRELDLMGLSDVEKAAIATANSPLLRELKSRHIQMIAIGGAIGTGLFIGSGSALATGGPGAILIGFTLTGMMLFATVHALGELAVCFPVAGAFSTYANRFVDPALGFAVGWSYAVRHLIVFPLELVAASITIHYWDSGNNVAATVNPAAWVCIFYVVCVAINMFGVKGYGEAEFAFSLVKVLAIVGYIILGIILASGGGPKGQYIGGKYWKNPGAFAAGFKGVVSVFVTAAFSFSGTEMIGLAAAETRNPRKTLPSATKQVFWRIALFYIIALTIVGFLVPYNEPELLDSSSKSTTKASPFVISIENAGIYALPSIFNVVILISVLSVGNTAVYASSRTMAAMAAQGQAPKILGYIDRKGRPLVSLGITALFGLLCFIVASGQEDEAFKWMLSLSALSCIFTWATICLCHIRFRQGLKAQGRNISELAFTSGVGVWGSWFGLIMNCLVFFAQIWVGLYPVGAKEANVKAFFKVYLAVPVTLLFYVPYKIYYKTKVISPRDMDLNTGRREIDMDLLQLEVAEENDRIRNKGFIYRVYKFWC